MYYEVTIAFAKSFVNFYYFVVTSLICKKRPQLMLYLILKYVVYTINSNLLIFRFNVINKTVIDVAYLGEILYPNNSVIDLEDIGEGGAGLHCYTEVATCCRGMDNPNGNSSGVWLFPNGEVVGSRSSSRLDVFSRTRDRRSVILHRGPEATGPTGIFTCEVPDSSGATQKLYYGIYSRFGGTLCRILLLQ